MTGEPALAALVREQRWFGSKSRALAGGRIADAGALSADCVLALFEVEFADGGHELYQLPYRVAADAEKVIGLADPPLAHALLAALRRSARVATEAAAFEFELTAVLPGEDELEPVRSVGGEQSNSSVVFGERCILKAYRRLEAGESPELEMLRFLDAHGFEQVAAPARLVRLRRARASPPRSASCRSSRPARATAGRTRWTHSPTPAQFLSRLRRLGEVTARMHGVLASDAADPAFAPEEPGAVVAKPRRRRLAGRGPRSPIRARARARCSSACAHCTAPAPAARRSASTATTTSARCCGPAATGSCSTSRASPRGRSPSAAARARRCATSRACCARSPTRPRRAERVERRPPRTGSATRAPRSWAATTDAIDDSLLPPAGEPREALLAACELEKALYELRYELDNRPDWVHVPVAGILRASLEARGRPSERSATLGARSAHRGLTTPIHAGPRRSSRRLARARPSRPAGGAGPSRRTR